MSAALSPAPAAFLMAEQPDAPDGRNWLVLEQIERAGDLLWMVHSAWTGRLQAEAAAGFHDSPAVAFLLREAERGWLQTASRGWTRDPNLAGRFGGVEARAAINEHGALEVLVLRANGRITLPTSTEFTP